MVADAARAALIGLVLGAATGVPLGVVNVSVIEAARRGGRRHAALIGVGGAIADTIHAGLAFVGLAPLIARHPALMRALAIGSAAIVIGYALIVWARARRPGHVVAAAAPAASPARAVLTGVALTLPNPAPLLAWIAVAAALLPGASISTGVIGAIGVGLGSAAWFALLARIAARAAPSPMLTRWLPQVVAVALVGISATAIARVW